MLAHAAPNIAPLQIPRFVNADPELAARWSAPAFVVVAPGEAAGVELRPGDVLVTGDAPVVGDFVMLVPRRHGRPMLGRLTRRGLVAEPGGVPCSAERWRAIGRVALRVRSEPMGGGPRVLHFPAEAEAEQQSLALPAATDSAASALRVALRLESEVEPRLERLLAQRLPELRRVSERVLIGHCGPAFAKAPMALAESLVIELRRRFGVNLSVVVGKGEDLALSVVAQLEPGAAAVATAAPRAAELPAPAAPAPRQAPRQVPLLAPRHAPRQSPPAAENIAPKRQLGLWS